MIQIDSREDQQHPHFANELRAFCIKVVVDGHLPVGDFFILGEEKNIILERMTPSNYVQKVASRQMIDQILKLVSVENAEPRLLIEGSLAMIKKFAKKWNMSSIMGNLISIMEGWRIPIIFVPTSYWTTVYLERLHHRLNGTKASKLYPLRVKPKKMSMNEKIRCVVEGIEGIGPGTADKLMKHFMTIDNFADAGIEQLQQVEGIGKKTAEKIFEVLHGEYQGESG